MSNYRRYFNNNNPIFITFVTQNRKEILIENIPNKYLTNIELSLSAAKEARREYGKDDIMII